MKILILASNYRKITVDSISAPERITALIADDLVNRGYDVTLAASGDSRTKAKLFSVSNKECYGDINLKGERHVDFEFMLIKEAIKFANKNNIEIIHSQLDTRSAIYADFAKMPVIATLHSPIDGRNRFIMEKYRSDQSYISISDVQREGAPSLNYIETIYHGMNLDGIRFEPNPKDALITVGRISPEKGIDLAIEIAVATNKKLEIIGRIDRNNSNSVRYFNEKIEKIVDSKKIGFTENVPYREVFKSIRNAKAFLFPIQWEEPFGLVMTEAMACGTPVIAFARGSVPEVLKDGVTGFIVNSSEKDKRGSWIIKKTGVEGMIEAVKKIYAMPKEEYQAMRRACRAHVEHNFTVDKMVDGYEKVYARVLASHKNINA